MEKRNLFTIGFLLIASTIVLTVFGWGAKNREDEGQNGSQLDSVMVMGSGFRDDGKESEEENELNQSELTTGEATGIVGDTQSDIERKNKLNDKEDELGIEENKKLEQQKDEQELHGEEEEESEEKKVEDEKEKKEKAEEERVGVEKAEKEKQKKIEEEDSQTEQQKEVTQNEDNYQDVFSPEGTSVRMAVITSKALNVRNKAKKDAKVIRILERDMVLEVLEEYEDGWAKIRCEDIEGYVYSNYIKLQE